MHINSGTLFEIDDHSIFKSFQMAHIIPLTQIWNIEIDGGPSAKRLLPDSSR